MPDHNYKPDIILYYNMTKGGVDLLDQKLKYYHSGRRTSRWPLALFINFMDICAHNAFVLWTELNPDWNRRSTDRRRLFLLELGKALTLPLIRQRDINGLQRPILRAIAATTGDFQIGFAAAAAAMPAAAAVDAAPFHHNAADPPPTPPRGRCYLCGREGDRKSKDRCTLCNRFICARHSQTHKAVTCSKCQNNDFDDN